MKYFLLILPCLLFACTEEQPPPVISTIAPEPWFKDVALEWGVDFQYQNGSTGQFHIAEVTGGAPALFDYDNDGDLDLYLVQGQFPGGDLTNVLYENVDGKFVDRTEGSGADDKGYAIGVTTGDFDSDGDVDLYVTNLGRNALLRNDGRGKFTNVAKEAGLEDDGFSACAAFGDIDNDGDLDLVVTKYLDLARITDRACFDSRSLRTYCNPTIYNAPMHDSLFLNNGEGIFKDISESSGLSAIEGTGLGVFIANITSDNLPDIFIANDAMPDRLWVNQGDGTFVDEAMKRNIAMDDTGVAKAGMGATPVDIDQDGDLDVFVTNILSESDSFYRNDREFFQDMTRKSGLSAESRAYTRWGIVFADFNNDGLLDLFETTGGVATGSQIYSTEDPLAEPNLLFKQEVGGRFVKVQPQGGTRELLIESSHGVAAGDIDGDGGVDLVIVNTNGKVNIFRNSVQNRGDWVSFRVLNTNNTDAIGAQVEIILDDGSRQFAQVQTARGYASAHSPKIHFGLGKKNIKEAIITWVDGKKTTIESPKIGVEHSVKYAE
jgi:hypothetical protein